MVSIEAEFIIQVSIKIKITYLMETMKLNSTGTVKAFSVREAKRVYLKPKESQSISYPLANARRGGIGRGEIAVNPTAILSR